MNYKLLNILLGILLGVVLCISCDREVFEETDKQVYTFQDINHCGGFNDKEDSADCRNTDREDYTVSINDTTCEVNFQVDYRCNAHDSIVLKGNTLKLYLKSTNPSDECYYFWNILLNYKSDKGIRILSYGFEENGYVKIGEVIYDDFIIDNK